MKRNFYFIMCLAAAALVVGCEGKGPGEEPEDPETVVKINEAYSCGKDGIYPLDWVELYNPSDKAVDISGYVLSDKVDLIEKVTIPAGTSLAAHAFFVIEVDVAGGFGLSGTNGDAVYLYNKDGEQIDFVEFGAMDLDQSWSANPDGSSSFRMQEPTLGASNNEGKVTPMVNIVSQIPASPTTAESVVVTAIVAPREGTLTSVVLQWTIDGVAQADIEMTDHTESGTWRGTIPAQAADTTIEYAVVAKNSVGGESASEGRYSVRGSGVVDYTGLVINEVDGNGKFIELYNNSSAEISLSGLVLIKNEETNAKDVWWTGSAVMIAPGAYYTICEAGAAVADQADEATGNGGISPKKNVKFELKKPDNSVIDSFTRSTALALDVNCVPDYGQAPKYSFSRCPDGTGDFGLATPSCDVANPAEAAGAIETSAPAR